MTELTDEDLMGLADGELTPERAREVSEIVARRPDLARKVEIYRATGRMLGDVVARAMPPAAVDDALAARILATPLPSDQPANAADVPAARGSAPGIGNGVAATSGPAGTANGSGKVLQFPGPGGRKSRGRAEPGAPRRAGGANTALAAGLAALVAAAFTMTVLEWRSSTGRPPETTVAGRTSGSTGSADTTTTLSVAALGGALETTPSSKSAPVAGGWTVTPILTFQARDGRYCREYSASHVGGSAMAGLACRDGGGKWTSIAEAATAAPDEVGRGQAAPVGRPATPPAVDNAVRALEDQSRISLGADAEAALIAKHWN